MPNTSRELEIFNFKDAQVRAVMKDGEAWFALIDVCKILEIGNASDVARRLPERHKAVDTIKTPGGRQQMRVISGPGLYRAIFMSRKPEAEEIIDWVTEQVIPSILKTGKYMLPENDPVLLQIRLTDAVGERDAAYRARATDLELFRRGSLRPLSRRERER